MNGRMRIRSSNKKKKTALIAEGNSTIGYNIATCLESTGNWNVIIISSQKLSYAGTFEFIWLDCLNTDAIDLHQEKLQEITHIFFSTSSNRFQENIERLNLVTEIEKIAPWLEHIIFIQETIRHDRKMSVLKPAIVKRYVPFTPCLFFHLYSPEEEFLRQESINKKWGWTSLRSNTIIDISIDNSSNIATQIALYATLCKEEGSPMLFPGSEEKYNSQVDITTLNILTESMQYILSQNSCKGEIFNITSGNGILWKDLWVQISKYFGILSGRPNVFPLALYMQSRDDLWKGICEKYKLKNKSLLRSLNWYSSDLIFNDSYNILSDPQKIHRFGFIDNQTDIFPAFRKMFDQLKTEHIIPAYLPAS
ncbi:hypothetical protein [Dysgonomonas capnocytophagoides]|uniref:hypothetical protein n=1 Tax=Dysgonomonas capnocytophagoides TaxID=45254 RepID=UPI003994533B